ncbi:MAG TPA: cupredoxin domain-containing protein [Thermomicrobiales bacterium]|nr:cupredoxin domain-containing protein [Thermomicrobiales bacterium]
MSGRTWGNRAARVVALALAIGGLTACVGQETKPSQPVESHPIASPGTATSLEPVGIQTTDVKVSDGKFGVDSIALQEDRPSIVKIDNADATPYRFQVAPDLVIATPVPASTTTAISFTNPKAGAYKGELLPAQGDQPLDSLDVNVQAASGNVPPQPTNVSNQGPP